MVGLTTPGDFSTSSSIGYSKARITIFKKEVDGGLKEFTRRFTAALFLRASPFSGATLFLYLEALSADMLPRGDDRAGKSTKQIQNTAVPCDVKWVTP
mgnify:CR=1 FL=1